MESGRAQYRSITQRIGTHWKTVNNTEKYKYINCSLYYGYRRFITFSTLKTANIIQLGLYYLAVHWHLGDVMVMVSIISPHYDVSRYRWVTRYESPLTLPERCNCIAKLRYCHRMSSVCLSVCRLYVTRVYCDNTTANRITRPRVSK